MKGRIFGFLLLALLTASATHSQARGDTLPPPENQRCANYAHNAVSNYETMRRFRQCFTPDNPRWQADYRNHYRWCMTARPEWLASENKARDAHLVHCDVRHSY
jgi:hypothetical protein